VTGLRDLERDVGTGLAGPDDEHRSGQELAGVVVLGRVELADARVELIGDLGNPRQVFRSAGNDDVVGREGAL
jgi:hypothetical protein